MHSTLQEDVQTAVSAAVSARRIPLHLFNRKFIKDIDTFYGEYQAGADAESKGPLTSFTFDDVEPGVVAERG